MKQLLIVLFAYWGSLQISLAQSDSSVLENIPSWVKPVLEKSELAQKHRILTSFNPFYLEADFSGDKQDDIAFFVENTIDHSKGVLIVNKGKNLVFVIGCGSPTDMGASLSWGKRWFVFREKTIWNSGKKKVSIKYPGIQVKGTGEASLVIYWTGKKYKTFVQQS